MDQEERLRSALADRYQIEHEIGRGGMATVYLAQDLKHDRKVAVKVLNPDLAQNLGAERFLREIRTAANLTHPHILPIHDSGEADGFLYYVMPYAKGESLRSRLTKEKQLPVEDAIQITREIADALAYAHREGVIHRDVKPANIMLEEGHAVLADFGVAHAVAEAKDQRLTRTGTSLGTPAYMSPEQATGEQDLDGRSDQYALGCVLYEMLAGHPPFTGAQVEAVIRQHLTEEPPSVTGARPSVTEEVVKVINRALSKSPADRFRTTGEMAAALAGTTSTVRARSRWGRTKAAVYAGTVVLGLATVAVIAFLTPPEETDSGRHRVVVLPLVNETGDPSLDPYGNWASHHVSDGLTRAQLTEVVDFLNVALEASEPGPGGQATSGLLRSWPERTRATLAVVGGFYPLGDSIEFRLRIVDTEATLRAAVTPVSGSRNNPEEALGKLQSQVVRTLAELVAPSHELAHTAAGRTPPKLEAQEALLEAWRTFASVGYEASLTQIKRAIELDPAYLYPVILLRAAYANLGRWAEADSVCEILGRRIDEANPLERLSVELFCPATRSSGKTDVEISRAMVQTDPNNNYIFGLKLLNANRPREAGEAFSRYDTAWGSVSRAWEETNAFFWAMSLHLLGDYAVELGVVRDVRQRFPNDPDLVNREIGALIALGKTDEARALIRDQVALRAPGQTPGVLLTAAGEEFAAHGHQDIATEMWKEALDWYRLRPAPERDSAASRREQAWILLRLQRPGEADSLLAPLVSETPEDLNNEWILGILRAQQGDRDAAERISSALETWDPPVRNGLNTLWRARIAAQLGDLRHAVQLLEQAAEEGWNIQDVPHRDALLKPLRDYPPFQEFLRPKG